MATNTQQQPNTILTRPKATAAYFQISVMTLHRWRQIAEFPQPLSRGSVVLYDVAAITAWLADGEV